LDFFSNSQQVYSDHRGVFSNPGNAFSRGQYFFSEAKRLWKAQEGLSALSSIQALVMMCCVYGALQGTRIGRGYANIIADCHTKERRISAG
jgi:hypothetical protein